MKNLFKLLLLVIIMTIGQACGKEEAIYPPMLKTLEPTEIQKTSALLQAEITTLGSEPIIRKGFCWLEELEHNVPRVPYASDNAIEVTEGTNLFSYLMTDLKPNTTYYVRAFVQTSQGVHYGGYLGFTTDYETITDIDGNVYTIVKIGDQYWTRENFKATRLRDGTPIPNWTEVSNWSPGAPKQPGMCWYDNNREKYETPYGALYNWHAASHPLIAPEGWKVPHIDDFEELRDALGGLDSNAGGRMKVPGTSYWQAPNAGATNDSDFSAYPAGANVEDGFKGITYSSLFWASSSYVNSTELADAASLQWMAHYFWVSEMSSTYRGQTLRLVKE